MVLCPNSVHYKMSTTSKHIIGWAAYFLILLGFYLSQYGITEAIASGVVIFIFQTVLFYLNYSLWVPRFYERNQYILYGVLASISVISVSLIVLFCWEMLATYGGLNLKEKIYYDFGEEGTGLPFAETLNLKHFASFSAPMIMALFASFVIRSIRQRIRKSEKEKLLVFSESRFLKSQINPHFLFNVLNNIYSLSLSNSPKTPDAVYKLSEMLDYSLYGCNEESVTLENEIKYINNYIDLFKLKDSQIKQIQFEHSEANPEDRISPMLLIPFVENAFKHGNIFDKTHGWINISLVSNRKEVVFQVENSVSYKFKNKAKSSGIGIQNVKRRLEIDYPGRYNLLTVLNNNIHSIELRVRI